MKKERTDSSRNQETKGRKTRGGDTVTLPQGIAPMLIPMVTGMMSTKQALQDWVCMFGLAAMQYLFATEAERLAGPKNKRKKDRQMYHWGATETAFDFAGRKVVLPRPRVRTVGGQEARLPLVEQLRESDPLAQRVVEQILLGVSTRGYEASLGQLPSSLRKKADSKSSASRRLVEETNRRMSEFISCSLEGIRFCVIMIDGIVVAKRSVIVVLGVDDSGKKYPLGLRLGSTENSTVCAQLLQELLDRGLSVQSKMLFVIDGAKGIRKAVIDVFGTDTLIQRCRNHKLRNVRDHLAKHRHAYVMRAMREAYQSQTAETARKHLKTLLSWLESNGESKAASSLREGLEETLTVHKLRLPRSLRSCLGTTNLIENLMGTIRWTCRNVKRWKNGDMVTRWTALAISTAQRKFRRIQGYRDLGLLIAELDKRTGNLDKEGIAA